MGQGLESFMTFFRASSFQFSGDHPGRVLIEPYKLRLGLDWLNRELTLDDSCCMIGPGLCLELPAICP